MGERLRCDYSQSIHRVVSTFRYDKTDKSSLATLLSARASDVRILDAKLCLEFAIPLSDGLVPRLQ